MPKRPRRGNNPSDVTYKEIAKVLRKIGFIQSRQKGRHLQFEHNDGRHVTVPKRIGFPIGLFLAIVGDAGLTKKEFFRILETV